MRNKYEVRGDVVAIKINYKGTELEATFDVADFAKVNSVDLQWCVMWHPQGKTYYVFVNPKNRGPIYLHRFILDAEDGLDVDHRNHNGLDNRRSNIRQITKTGNQLNRRLQSNNTSGVCGVSWDADRSLWRAQGKIHHKTVFLGRFREHHEAAQVATDFRTKLRGTNG